MKRYCGRKCYCDHCCAGYNAANHEYLRVTKAAPRYGESYEDQQLRAIKQAEIAAKQATERSRQS